MKHAKDVLIILASLFVFLGIPAFIYGGRLYSMYFEKGTDAVSGATVEIPDQPSGEYVILVNRSLHSDTMPEWESFFHEEPVGVIFEDLVCTVAEGDAGGLELAERYRARLAENQMKIKQENGLMAASKAQWGVFDVMAFSKEIADAYHIETVSENRDIDVITVTSEA
ncbi:MAG: hypothetical protein IJ123_08025 [Blautia sp.]|nr:hypothetical protein [Blautia sp.]